MAGLQRNQGGCGRLPPHSKTGTLTSRGKPPPLLPSCSVPGCGMHCPTTEEVQAPRVTWGLQSSAARVNALQDCRAGGRGGAKAARTLLLQGRLPALMRSTLALSGWAHCLASGSTARRKAWGCAEEGGALTLPAAGPPPLLCRANRRTRCSCSRTAVFARGRPCLRAAVPSVDGGARKGGCAREAGVSALPTHPICLPPPAPADQ